MTNILFKKLECNFPSEDRCQTLKAFAYWIQRYGKSVTHHHQIGFVSKIQGWFSLRKSVCIIIHINAMKDFKIIISIELGK